MPERSTARQLSGLVAVVLASSCGARSELSLAGQVDGAAGEGLGVLDGSDDGFPDQGVSDSEAPNPSVQGSPDGAMDDDGGCLASVLTYQSPDPTFGACWMTAEEKCSSQLAACASDCTCNRAIANALTCVDTGGGTVSCFTSAILSAGDPTLSDTSGCLMGAYPGSNCVGPMPNVDAAPPTVARDAAAACTSTGGGGGGGAGGCSQTYGETCGSAAYAVTCACPLGQCVCSGASNRAVAFPGCPYCGSPTTAEEVFALCGFPH